MKFCVNCRNMYYFKIDEETCELRYYCRKCGHIENEDKNIKVNEVTYTKDNINNISLNPYIKYDPSIPFTSDIKCPNEECITHKDKSIKPKVIYYRYDDDNLKYIYMCCHCDSSWKP